MVRTRQSTAAANGETVSRDENDGVVDVDIHCNQTVANLEDPEPPTVVSAVNATTESSDRSTGRSW